MVKKVLLKEMSFISKDDLNEFSDFGLITNVNYIKVLGSITKAIEFENFEYEIAQLQKITVPQEFKHKESFWINVYNTLCLHAVILAASRNESPLNNWFHRGSYFKVNKYMIAGHEFSMDDIEHGILRANPNHFVEGDTRASFCLEKVDPRVFSALNCVTRSSAKPLIIYHTHVERYLNYTTKRYYSKQATVCETSLTLPTQCHWYCDDFGPSRDHLIKFVSQFLTKQQNDTISALLRANRLVMKFNEYDWEPYIEVDEYDLDPIEVKSLL